MKYIFLCIFCDWLINCIVVIYICCVFVIYYFEVVIGIKIVCIGKCFDFGLRRNCNIVFDVNDFVCINCINFKCFDNGWYMSIFFVEKLKKGR